MPPHVVGTSEVLLLQAATKLTNWYSLPGFHLSARITCLTIGFYALMTKAWHVEQAAKLGLVENQIINLRTLSRQTKVTSYISSKDSIKGILIC